MHPIIKATFVVLVMLSSFAAHANKKVYCTGSSTNGVYVCSWQDMKLYNQRIVSDSHCFPTAAAMGLSEMTYGGVSYYVSSWTGTEFVNKSESQRIINMGELMNTTEEDGTGAIGVLKYKARAADFPDADGGFIAPVTNKIDNIYIRSRVIDRKIDMLGYGHWKEKCESILGVMTCSFSRNGGHGTTVNGYTSTSGVYGVKIYDPWNGVIKNYVIQNVANNSGKLLGFIPVDLRPFQGNTTMVYGSGDNRKIIETISAIQSN